MLRSGFRFSSFLDSMLTVCEDLGALFLGEEY